MNAKILDCTHQGAAEAADWVVAGNDWTLQLFSQPLFSDGEAVTELVDVGSTAVAAGAESPDSSAQPAETTGDDQVENVGSADFALVKQRRADAGPD